MWRTCKGGFMEDWIYINLAFILASSLVSATISLWVWSDWAKCFSLWARSLGNCMLEIFKFLSKLIILWLFSCVKLEKSHSFLYSEKIFSSTVLTLSIFLANSTYSSAIPLDIFSFTFPWNYLSDHSLTFVSWSSQVTWSTISNNCSIMGFDSSIYCKLKVSIKMSLISYSAYLCLYYFLSISYHFLLFNASYILLWFHNARPISSRNGDPLLLTPRLTVRESREEIRVLESKKRNKKKKKKLKNHKRSKNWKAKKKLKKKKLKIDNSRVAHFLFPVRH